MKIAVVGPTGVLGRALVPMLLQQGHGVRALARAVEKAKRIFPGSAEVVPCDLLAPDVSKTIQAALQGCDTVVHIATAIPTDFNAPHAWDANTRLRTDGVKVLLEAALTAGVRQYIQQSITMAYPDHGDDWITEDTLLDTSADRARTNGPVIRMEEMIREIPTSDLEWCILRGGSFVGPGTFQDKLMDDLRAGTAVIPCDGRNFLSLIHAADMAAAVAAAIKHAPAGSTFNIVDEPLRQREYYERLAASVGAEKPRHDERKSCPPSWRCDNRRAKTGLSWQPIHDVIPKR